MGALFGFTGAPDPRLAERMAEALAHRGRGETRTVQTPHGTLGVRAAIPEQAALLRSASIQKDEQRVLALSGYLTTPRVEPATLFAEHRQRGADFVRSLRGAFTLALLDGDRLLLARDGAGVRTLYWARHEGRLLFAVEPKAILTAPGFPRRVRPAALAQYLAMSFVPGEGTMLEGVHELLPGHRLESVGGGEPRSTRWFLFELEPDEPPDEHHDFVAELCELSGRAVAERLPKGEPVGVFLSGGLDSSLVTAEVARQHDHPVLSYALHFGPEYANELDFARAVAERSGTEHHEILLRPKDFLPRLRRIIWHLDDPIGDPITVPNFELAARVARDVRWVFNGEGGDPVFGGPKNIPMLLHHWYGGIERERGFRERTYLASYRRSYDEWPRLLAPAWRDRVDAERDLEGVLSPFFESERPRSFLNKLSLINIRLKGAHLILPKVDRMAGASALVTLSPLFDERLLELSFRMPPRLKLDRGIEKIALKRAYASELPESVVRRPKSGMRVPVHYWFQGEMRRYAKKILSARELRRAGIFDEKRVLQLLAYDGNEGPGRFGLRLWMLVTFEIWRRIVVEGEAV
jgi:asparagine synthase (glutamine-hydrolysing)